MVVTVNNKSILELTGTLAIVILSDNAPAMVVTKYGHGI